MDGLPFYCKNRIIHSMYPDEDDLFSWQWLIEIKVSTEQMPQQIGKLV